MSEAPYISVIGAGQASEDEAAAAEEIGRLLAEAGARPRSAAVSAG